MKFTTQNSEYEVKGNKIRRLGPFGRHKDRMSDGGWHRFEELIGPEVGLPCFVKWGEKYTETSLVRRVS